MEKDGVPTKDIGEFRVTFYPGAKFAVVRAWRIGQNPTVVRLDPYPSWQLFEGDYNTGLDLYESLKKESDIARLCSPGHRNPMDITSIRIEAKREKNKNR